MKLYEITRYSNATYACLVPSTGTEYHTGDKISPGGENVSPGGDHISHLLGRVGVL